MEADHANDRPILRGWIQIADYLGVSIRTAQTLHQEWRLPVARCLSKRVLTSTRLVHDWEAGLMEARRVVASYGLRLRCGTCQRL